MPAPQAKGQLTAWLKSHGYRWVLKSPTGGIVSVSEAIRHIEEQEQEQHDHLDADDDNRRKYEVIQR